VIPSAGTITSWSTDQSGGGSGTLQFLVVRAGVVVAADARTMTSGLNTFTVSIPVEAGDLIAVSAPGTGSPKCGFAGSGPVRAVGVSGILTVGATLNFGSPFSGEMANVSANLVPAPPSPPSSGSGDRGAYCAATPLLRADGTTGVFVDLVEGQAATDPRYAGATRAVYGRGYGLTCDNLPGLGYTDTGTTVDGDGVHTGNPASDVYEYFTKP
jgi:hypothetical protein